MPDETAKCGKRRNGENQVDQPVQRREADEAGVQERRCCEQITIQVISELARFLIDGYHTGRRRR